MEENVLKWDLRFLNLASLISTWSRDPSTKCGAVIVRPDKTVASVGYNGFPKDMYDDPEKYANKEEKYSRIVHCEMNALLHLNEDTRGYTLYTTALCCDRCAVHMLQAGISRFVAWVAPDYESRWADSIKRTRSYYADCGAEHKEYQKDNSVLRTTFTLHED